MAKDEGATAVSQTMCSPDVFVSFWGEDTRHGFTGKLFEALHQKEINTFKDDEKLREGEQIAPEFLSTIEESKVAIIVFSENYAESSWCLDESAKIIQCRKEKSQMMFPIFYKVIPIFYKVDPSDVRHQRNNYGRAMTKHETEFGVESEKVTKWKSSLAEVANLKGYHIKWDEEECNYIEKIVRDVSISIKVSSRRLHINEPIVGLEHRVEELKSMLRIESKDSTGFLGIHGTGGIGKTTLAKDLYNSVCNHFEASCFLPSVRETSNIIEGKKLLLHRILTDMLNDETIRMASVDELTKTLKRKLGNKGVLLVLDDVDDIEQLRTLAGEHNWFGLGSRIIITTRDEHLLVAHNVEKRYKMEVLNERDSMQLFCHYAFKDGRTSDPNYLDLSNRAVSYAKGLPLALKVLGSHLITAESSDEWKSALDKYEKSPHNGIQSVLITSYDSLDDETKDIFLDIACFFKGQRMEYVKTIHRACEFFPEDGIRILVDRSLITVERSCLMMHDLLQDMGREIVMEENPDIAGERSRLWSYKDVLEVLKGDKGSNKIKGIMLDPPQREKDIEWIDTAFEKMKELRILIIRNTTFSSAPSYLPNELKLLDWKDYPSQTFPPCFDPENIVAFNLRGSLLVQPFQAFEHLTYMNVSNCNSVTQIPNVSGAKSLRELKLDGCKELVIVHESVGFLPNLVYLSASGCFQLQSFVPVICLPSLEYLSFNLCRGLQHFPETVGIMNKPLKIYLIDTSIEELPHSIGNLTGLVYLEMTSCNKLQFLPSSLFTLSNLVTLKVGGCSLLPKSFIKHDVSGAVRTLHFNIAGLSDEDLPMIIQSFPNLQDLNMMSNRFASFPACIQESISLTSLDVSECTRLVEIPELPSSVQKVNARHCYSLNDETLGMLWFQVSKEVNGLEVIMPRSEIPEWFDHRKEGGMPVFRARGKFPVVVVAFAFDKLYYKGSIPRHWETVSLQLFIEGEQVHRKHNQTFYVSDDHVLLCDLRVMFSDEEWKVLNARLDHDDNDWKTVQVACETSMTLSCWGVYVYKRETNLDDIQFSASTSPYHSHPSFSTVHHQNRLVETSEKNEVMNVIEGMNVPVMFEGFMMELRAKEEQGEFDNVGPKVHECNQFLLTLLEKMSKRVTGQREGNDSGFNLEDEDAKESESTMQNIAEAMLRLMKDHQEKQRQGEDAFTLPRRMYHRLVHKANMTMPKSQDHGLNVAAGPSYEAKDGEELIRIPRQHFDELVRAIKTMPSQDHAANVGGPNYVPQYHDEGILSGGSEIGAGNGNMSMNTPPQDPSSYVPPPNYHEDGIMMGRRLYDELLQANMTMPSQDHVVNTTDPSSVPQYDDDDDEVVTVERQLYDELVQANMTMSSLYHDGKGTYATRSSDIGETSGQSSQDDDVVKVQYYIFDFTKQ